jgi:hypothetical protein
MFSVANFSGRAYQTRFDGLAQRGVDVQDEATLVLSLTPASVLDAGWRVRCTWSRQGQWSQVSS